MLKTGVIVLVGERFCLIFTVVFGNFFDKKGLANQRELWEYNSAIQKKGLSAARSVHGPDERTYRQ